MKLKAIEAICKARKTIIVTTGPNGQWIGDGSAFYPIYDLPDLDENIILTIFDVPEDERGKWVYNWHQMQALNFADLDDSERLVQADMLVLQYGGRSLAAIATREHISFLDTTYLKPYKRGSYELYERMSTAGQVYFTVKSGFELIGVIAPCSVVTKDIAEKLERMAVLCQGRVDAEAEVEREVEEP